MPIVDPPCSRFEALSRALLVAARRDGQYILGTGDYRPADHSDVPWTARDGAVGSDCAGFAICHAWKLVRHRPPFNRGPWSSVEDDLNCNSLIEDADHDQVLALPADTGPILPGDLLVYPTIHLNSPHGPLTFVGHVGMIAAVPGGFDTSKRAWSLLSVVQCHGPNGFSPGAVLTDGAIWQNHDANWGKPEHHTRVIRIKER